MQNLKQRTFNYAVAVGKLYDLLPLNDRKKIYLNQLVRCSSSVGANYRAAQRAKSTADFLNKLKIVEEEADESIYFLELLFSFNTVHSNQLEPIIKEGTEILKIIIASIVTTKSNIRSADK